ncbi:MAG: hypothetical protein ACRC62_20330 [Microcoleus sp.]
MPPALPEYIFQKASHYFDAEIGLIIVIKKNDEFIVTHFSPAAAKIWGFTDFEQVQREVIGQPVKTLMPRYVWDAHDKWIDASRTAAIDLRDKNTEMAMREMGKKNALPIASRKTDVAKAFLKFESFTDGEEIVSLVGAIADVDQQEGESVKLVSTFSSFVTKMIEIDIEQAAKKTEKMAESVKKIGLALTSMGAVAVGIFIGIKTFVVNTFNLGNIKQTDKVLTALDPRESEVSNDLKSVATRIMASADTLKGQKIVRAFLLVYSEQDGKYYSSFRQNYQWVAPKYDRINGTYPIQRGVDFERFTTISQGKCYSIDTTKLEPTDSMTGALQSSGAVGQIMCQVKNEKLLGGLAIEYNEPLKDMQWAEDLLQIEAGRFSTKYFGD